MPEMDPFYNQYYLKTFPAWNHLINPFAATKHYSIAHGYFTRLGRRVDGWVEVVDGWVAVGGWVAVDGWVAVGGWVGCGRWAVGGLR